RGRASERPTGPIAKEASPPHPRFESLKKSLPLSSMTTKAGKRASESNMQLVKWQSLLLLHRAPNLREHAV
ncbi:MAG: hypothetical protein WCD87_22950, partial [Pseudolabrys sp.]